MALRCHPITVPYSIEKWLWFLSVYCIPAIYCIHVDCAHIFITISQMCTILHFNAKLLHCCKIAKRSQLSAPFIGAGFQCVTLSLILSPCVCMCCNCCLRKMVELYAHFVYSWLFRFCVLKRSWFFHFRTAQQCTFDKCNEKCTFDSVRIVNDDNCRYLLLFFSRKNQKRIFIELWKLQNQIEI